MPSCGAGGSPYLAEIAKWPAEQDVPQPLQPPGRDNFLKSQRGSLRSTDLAVPPQRMETMRRKFGKQGHGMFPQGVGISSHEWGQ